MGKDVNCRTLMSSQSKAFETGYSSRAILLILQSQAYYNLILSNYSWCLIVYIVWFNDANSDKTNLCT